MRLGVDLSTLTPVRTGVGRYTQCLVDALSDLPEITEIHGFAPGPILAGWNPPAKLQLHTGKGGRRLPWLLATLPRAIRAHQLDIVHFPNYLAPSGLHVPYVVTVHDMTTSLFPHLHPWRRKLTHRWLLPGALRRAAAIITVSEVSKRDLVAREPELARTIHVIPEAAAPHLRRVNDEAALRRIQQRYGLPQRFILTVGGFDRRKNLPRLIQSVMKLKLRHGLPVDLVATGGTVHPPVKTSGLLDLGHVPDEDLPALYTLAAVCAYPSLYEGFGLPPIEAMACGTPVVASSAGAIPEICGDAVLSFDPCNEEEMTESLRRVLQESSLAEALVNRGHERVRRYSWERTARLTLKVYEAAIQ